MEAKKIAFPVGTSSSTGVGPEEVLSSVGDALRSACSCLALHGGGAGSGRWNQPRAVKGRRGSPVNCRDVGSSPKFDNVVFSVVK